MSNVDVYYDEGQVEALRLGTRKQYQSDWTSVADGGSVSFTHDLGEIPWVVDVIRSETSEGKFPVESNADVTVTKTDTTVTVTSSIGATRFIRVRAM